MKRFLAVIILFCGVLVAFAQTPPVAANDTFTINKNNTVLFFALANDYDLDGDPLSLTILTSPVHGAASVTGNTISYTPFQNFSGTDSFVYVVCDTTNLCDTAVVYINITAVNNPPYAGTDTYTIPVNTGTSLPVLSNDSDPDGDPLSLTVILQPEYGTVTVNGNNVAYVPALNYSGSDSFIYVICDTANLCDTAVVYLTIQGNNTPPVGTDDIFVFGDTLETNTVDLLINDFDNNGDSLFVASINDLDSANNLGSFSISSQNTIEFTRAALACGTETFEYIVCDYADCDTSLISVTVTCPEDIFHTQGFSPDGDGLNDKLVFTGLEYFSPVILRVYNRYGAMVYDSDEYKNDWDGTYKNSPLPDGTYFYVLQLANGKKYNDYLVINR